MNILRFEFTILLNDSNASLPDGYHNIMRLILGKFIDLIQFNSVSAKKHLANALKQQFISFFH